ncbi:MAG: AI-2E family transporter [Gemmatimonadaceae bacterium]
MTKSLSGSSESTTAEASPGVVAQASAKSNAVHGPPGPPPGGERRNRAMGWRTRDIMRAVALIFALYVGLKLLWFAREVVLAIFLGVLFGLAVSAGVDRLQRWRIPRGIGAAVIVLAFFGLLSGLGAWMAPTIREQGSELRQRLPEAIDRVESWLNDRPGLMAMILGSSDAVQSMDSATTTLGQRPSPTPPREAAAPPAAATIEGDSARISSLRERITQQFSGATRYLFPFLSSTLTVFAGLLLITFLAIYIAAEPHVYHRGLMHLFPHRGRSRAGEVFTAIAAVLRRWLVTQLIAMLVIGVVTTVGLLILDVKAAYALGLIAGLMEFIPTVGPILSAIPAIAMGFLDSPEKALYVTLLYVGVQFLENHILIPMLMKGGVDLPPAMTIVSQAVMALVFGFLGLMVAVPMLAAIMVPMKMLYVQDVVGDAVSVVVEEGEDD